MTKINTISPRNTMAISAMLMLSVGSAYAQEVTVPATAAPATVEPPVAAAPVVAPAPSAATPSTPTIVIPTPAPEPVAAPSAAPAATPPARARATAAPTSRAPAREAAQPAPVAATPTPQVAEPAVPSAAPVAAAPADAAPPPPVATDDGASDWALPVGAAATLLVLGGVGFAMSRRRRAYEEDVDFVPPVATRPAFRPQPETRTTAPVAPERLTAPTFAMSPVAARTASEREALIERIVAAAPDDANPFTSRKARRRRARIMVQSMMARSDVPAARPAEPAAQEQREIVHA